VGRGWTARGGRRLALLPALLIGTAAFGAPSPAVASTPAQISIAEPTAAQLAADPTSRVVISVTAGPDDGVLRVVRVPGASSCPSSPDSGIELFTVPSDGGAPVSGSAEFAPGQAGSQEICAYSGSDPPVGAGFTAAWDALVVVFGDYTDDAPVDFTVAYTASPSTGLYMYAEKGKVTCASTAALEAARPNAKDAFMVPTAMHRVQAAPAVPFGTAITSSSFRPSDHGDYTACVYLADSPSSQTRKLTSQFFTVRAASASISVTQSADPTAGRTTSLGFDASADISGRLFYAFVNPSGVDCRATPAAEAGTSGVVSLTPAGGMQMPTVTPPTRSTLHLDASYTPPAAGDYNVCAYVAAGPSGQVDGFKDAVISARALRFPLALTVTPTVAANGQAVNVHLTASAEAPRTLFSYEHPNAGVPCAPTAGQESARAASGGQALYDPLLITSSVDTARPISIGPEPNGYRFCAYLASSADAVPDATATATVVPPPPPPAPGPGGGGGGGGGGGSPGGDVDPGPIPREFGTHGGGSIYVNAAILPAGVTADRFITLVDRTAREWGFRLAGVTTNGTAHRDGRRVVGFSRRIPPEKISGLVIFRGGKRDCHGKGRHRRCSKRLKVKRLETDIALSRDLSTWQQGPAHPGPGQIDLESVLVRAFGQYAGNDADFDKCSESPLLAPSVDRHGAWWRGIYDYHQPGC
jgi:hypothetical protein